MIYQYQNVIEHQDAKPHAAECDLDAEGIDECSKKATGYDAKAHQRHNHTVGQEPDERYLVKIKHNQR